MTTVDHRFFPHIIDLIWAHLDYEGQVAARAACSDWRSRADARLRHLEFTCYDRPEADLIAVTTRDLSKPSAPPVWLRDISFWHDRYCHEMCEDCCSDDDDPAYQKAQSISFHMEDNSLKVIEVVDFVGFDLGWPHSPFELERNTFLCSILTSEYCVVRWFGTPPDLTEFHDYYVSYSEDFSDLPPSIVDIFMFEVKPNSPVDTLSWFNMAARERVQVINYFCHTDPTTSPPGLYPLVCEDHPYREVCPINVIFHNEMPQENGSPPALEPGLVAAYGQFVLGGNVVAIVGLEEFLQPDELKAYIKLVNREILKRRYVEGDYGTEVLWKPRKSCLKNLCYWTHAEYREHLGEEKYRIRTMR